MTDDSLPPKPRPDAPAPTEYFHYSVSPGDYQFYVAADLDVMADGYDPALKEKFFEEYSAYMGNHFVRPRLLDPKYLPKRLTLQKKRKVPSVFATQGFSIVADDSVRSAIEALEPGRHQFIPIKVFHRNGEEEPRKFFLLNVHHMVEALALEEMGVEHKTSRDGRPYLGLPMAALRKMKLRRAALNGAGHLFCDARCISPGSIWIISKEMVAAIRSAKGRLAELLPCEVID